MRVELIVVDDDGTTYELAVDTDTAGPGVNFDYAIDQLAAAAKHAVEMLRCGRPVTRGGKIKNIVPLWEPS